MLRFPEPPQLLRFSTASLPGAMPIADDRRHVADAVAVRTMSSSRVVAPDFADRPGVVGHT